MKKIISIFVLVVVLVLVVALVVVKKTRTTGIPLPTYQNNQTQQTPEQASIADFVTDVKNSTEFVGVIGTVYDPKEKDVRFFEIEADLVNLDELRNVDFSRNTMTLPTTKKTFTIAVDDSTTVTGVNAKEDIESGDMIKVSAGSSVYNLEEFTALEVEVVASR